MPSTALLKLPVSYLSCILASFPGYLGHEATWMHLFHLIVCCLVKRARLREIRSEMLNSEKLKVTSCLRNIPCSNYSVKVLSAKICILWASIVGCLGQSTACMIWLCCDLLITAVDSNSLEFCSTSTQQQTAVNLIVLVPQVRWWQVILRMRSYLTTCVCTWCVWTGMYKAYSTTHLAYLSKGLVSTIVYVLVVPAILLLLLLLLLLLQLLLLLLLFYFLSVVF